MAGGNLLTILGKMAVLSNKKVLLENVILRTAVRGLAVAGPCCAREAASSGSGGGNNEAAS
jgi:hypothetical protein